MRRLGAARLLVAIAAVCGSIPADAQPTAGSLTVGFATIPPHVMVAADGPAGFDIELWDAVGQAIGTRSELLGMDFAALMEAVKAGEVDVAVAGISVTHAREVEMDFSVPYMTTGLKIMSSGTPPPVLSRLASAISAEAVLAPLAWVVVFICLCALGLFLLERGRGAISEPIIPGIFQAAWCTVATVTTVGYGDIAPRTWAGRILCVAVMLIGIALFGIAVAELSAGITVSQMEATISSLDDLEDRAVATVRGTTSEDVARRHAERVHLVAHVQDAYRLLASGTADAVLFDASPLLHYARQNPGQHIVVADGLIGSEHYAFAFPQGSDLRESVNRALLQVMESGEFDQIYGRWFGARD